MYVGNEVRRTKRLLYVLGDGFYFIQISSLITLPETSQQVNAVLAQIAVLDMHSFHAYGVQQGKYRFLIE